MIVVSLLFFYVFFVLFKVFLLFNFEYIFVLGSVVLLIFNQLWSVALIKFFVLFLVVFEVVFAVFLAGSSTDGCV